jgi:hypothetical protein
MRWFLRGEPISLVPSYQPRIPFRDCDPTWHHLLRCLSLVRIAHDFGARGRPMMNGDLASTIKGKRRVITGAACRASPVCRPGRRREAVVLDLVQPRLAGRWLRCLGRQARKPPQRQHGDVVGLRGRADETTCLSRRQGCTLQHPVRSNKGELDTRTRNWRTASTDMQHSRCLAVTMTLSPALMPSTIFPQASPHALQRILRKAS